MTTAETGPQVVEGVNVTERVAEIEAQGYTIIPDFVQPNEIAQIRHAFDTEVRITEMRAIGTDTGKTLRAHNLLAKTRAVDYLFLDPRIRALIEGVLGPRVQIIFLPRSACPANRAVKKPVNPGVTHSEISLQTL